MYELNIAAEISRIVEHAAVGKKLTKIGVVRLRPGAFSRTDFEILSFRHQSAINNRQSTWSGN